MEKLWKTLVKQLIAIKHSKIFNEGALLISIGGMKDRICLVFGWLENTGFLSQSMYRPHLGNAGRDGEARSSSLLPHYPLASPYWQTWVGNKQTVVPWLQDWIASHFYIGTVLGIGLSSSGDREQESLSTAYFPIENIALFPPSEVDYLFSFMGI